MSWKIMVKELNGDWEPMGDNGNTVLFENKEDADSVCDYLNDTTIYKTEHKVIEEV